jgi:guanine nucleotide-binding protein alpha-1 subunit
VILLNLVRNVNTILDILERELSDPTLRNDDDDLESSSSPYGGAPSNSFHVQLAEKYHRLNLRLSPLRNVQKDLEARIGAASSEETSTGANGAYDPSLGLNALAELRERSAQEFSINSRNGWKSALNRVIPGSSPHSGGYALANSAGGDSITEAIASTRSSMVALWADPAVQDVLSRTPSRIQESPGL